MGKSFSFSLYGHRVLWGRLLLLTRRHWTRAMRSAFDYRNTFFFQLKSEIVPVNYTNRFGRTSSATLVERKLGCVSGNILCSTNLLVRRIVAPFIKLYRSRIERPSNIVYSAYIRADARIIRIVQVNTCTHTYMYVVLLLSSVRFSSSSSGPKERGGGIK